MQRQRAAFKRYTATTAAPDGDDESRNRLIIYSGLKIHDLHVTNVCTELISPVVCTQLKISCRKRFR